MEAIGLNLDSTNLQVDIDNGIISFDEDAAGTCLDAFDSLLGSCEVNFDTAFLRRLNEACDGVFVGTVATGGVCIEDEQCAGAAANCETNCSGQCCEGTCLAEEPEVLAEIGESCASADCVEGAFCENASMTCKAKVAVGAAC